MNLDYTLEDNFDRMLQAARERGFNQVIITKELVQRLRREFGLTNKDEAHENNGAGYGNNSEKRRFNSRTLWYRLARRKRFRIHSTH